MEKNQIKRRKSSFFWTAVGVSILSFLLGLTHVPNSKAAKTTSSTNPVSGADKVPSSKEVLAKLLKSNFTYERENRSDPFVPFIKKKKKEAKLQGKSVEPVEEEILTGMQLFEPGQLNLVSIVFAGDRALAMVQDSVGKGYIVEKGTKIGRSGIIEEIMPNVVVIKQWSLTFGGQKRYKNIEMVLRKEGD